MSTITEPTIETTDPLIGQPLGDWDGPIPDPSRLSNDDVPFDGGDSVSRPRRGRPPKNESDNGTQEIPQRELNPLLTVSGKPRKGALVRPLVKMYAGIGAVVVPFDATCGTQIINSAESCAKALDDLAQTNPAVARALLALVETSGWATVIAAHMPILFVILMHHVPKFQELMNERMSDVLGAMTTNEATEQ